jgi:hypothetical protein
MFNPSTIQKPFYLDEGLSVTTKDGVTVINYRTPTGDEKQHKLGDSGIAPIETTAGVFLPEHLEELGQLVVKGETDAAMLLLEKLTQDVATPKPPVSKPATASSLEARI